MSTQIHYIETDAGWIYDTVLSKLEENVEEPLYPGDERRIFGEGFSAVVVALLNYVDDRCRQSLLRYARGTILDAMGERVRCDRHEPTAAETTLRFSIGQAFTRNIVIPIKTKATADHTIYFETIEAAVLPAGSLSVDVPSRATVGGSAGNGYLPGSINNIVDLVSYVGGVSNLNETHGGDDGEPYDEDGDNRYRERIQLAPASLSKAGPEAGYKALVLAADSRIRDAAILSDQAAGTVNIIVLMSDMQGPDDEVVAKILKAANAKDARPMNDLVSVHSPEFPTYDIRLKYYVTADTATVAIQTIEGLNGSIDQYLNWQDGTIGRDINPDKLRALILHPNWEEGLTGALRVDITAPAFQELGERQVARFSGTAVVTHEVVKE